MSFGKQMRLRREELQLSRASLAEMLGVSPSAISNYENGVSSPKEEVLLRLSTRCKLIRTISTAIRSARGALSARTRSRR